MIEAAAIVKRFEAASSPPKRVLYVHFYPDRGGSATSLSLLVANLDRSRYVPMVVQAHPIMGHAADQLRAAGAEVDHLPVPLVWNRSWLSEANLRGAAWRAFRRNRVVVDYLRRLRPDIVHVNDFPAVAFAVAANELGIPVVWHSRLVLAARRLGHASARIIDAMTSRASRIIAISETEAGQFKGEKVQVIYNPLDLARIDRAIGSRTEMRRTLGVADDQFMVTAPVALTVAKGAWDYIPACAVATNLAPEVRFRFVLAGEIPDGGRRHAIARRIGLRLEAPLERAQRAIREAGLSDRFEVLGFRDDVYSIMEASDLIVFPSRLKACGRPCFEAGALGKPVIVTMPTKNTGVVLDGETGRVLPEADPEALGKAIAEFARSPGMVRQMGAAAKLRVRPLFGAAAHAQSVMQVYDGVLAESVG